jgi:hypothetical protein
MSHAAHGLTKYDMLVRECTRHEALNAPFPQTFGRIAPANPITGIAPDGKPWTAKNVIPAFADALDAMRDPKDAQGKVGAAMTFFGQFVDHDVTLDATSAIGTRIDPRSIRNIRTPGLDLDCVYGDGPDASPHLYSNEHSGYLLFGTKDNPRDLARTCKGVALIGDPRNDENMIVGQLQGLFICLHNIVMTALESDHEMCAEAFEGIRTSALSEMVDADSMTFEAARRIVRLHYQWLVVNDLLAAFVDAKVLKSVFDAVTNGELPKPFHHDSPLMPIEFSGAAYRFGHATVQNAYTLNDQLPKKVGLFEIGGFKPQPKEANIDFKHLLDYPGAAAKDKARPIGRKLPVSIFDLPFVTKGIEIDGEKLDVADAKKLPHRNVFRDRFALELASGQQIARAMGIKELAAPQELRSKGITKTPLWYYCLHEAESHGGKLGPVGGTIVATVLLRLLYLDHESVLCSKGDFKPWRSLGAGSNGAYSLGHLAKFVEENRDHVKSAKDLRCPD